MWSPDPSKRRTFIPPPVTRWLLLIVLSFAIGGVTIAVFPSVASVVLNIGVVTNVVLAIGMGVLLGWRMTLSDLPIAIFAGALVTVVGTNVLLPLLIVFDAVAIVVAVIGMSILLVVGAIAGTIARGLHSGCRCLRDSPSHGIPPSDCLPVSFLCVPSEIDALTMRRSDTPIHVMRSG
jgi:hypothetical protein